MGKYGKNGYLTEFLFQQWWEIDNRDRVTMQPPPVYWPRQRFSGFAERRLLPVKPGRVGSEVQSSAVFFPSLLSEQ